MTIKTNPKTFDEYQTEARKTCLPSCWNHAYLSLGLYNEAGEVAGLLKREIRGDKVESTDVTKELGDVLWYLSTLSMFEGFSLSKAAIRAANTDSIILFEAHQHPASFLERDKLTDFGNLRAVIDKLLTPSCWINEDLTEMVIANALIYLNRIALSYSISLELIACVNLEKLKSRYERGTITGKGDSR